MPEHFCTCKVVGCQFHPANHDKGCDLCIQKNLRTGEIPGCFWLKIHDDISTWTDFSFKGFAEFVKLYGQETESKS
jgi:hypothetical protein